MQDIFHFREEGTLMLEMGLGSQGNHHTIQSTRGKANALLQKGHSTRQVHLVEVPLDFYY